MNPARRLARLLLAVSAALLLAPHAPPAGAQVSGPQYVVRDGDTLYDIARNFGVSLEALQAANPGVVPSALSIGQSLVIPGFAGVSGTLDTQPLEPGASLDSLALRLGLKRDTLISLNRVVNPDLLYIQEPVVIVDQADGGPPIATGVMYHGRAGEGLLALAAARNQNPWALASANRLAYPGLLPPRAPVVVPGGDQPLKALPFPVRDVLLYPLPPIQGCTLAVRVVSSKPITATGALGDWPLRFNAGQAQGGQAQDLPLLDSWYALQGIYRLADPDLYRLTLTVTDAAGVTVRFSQPLPVRAGDYAVDRPLTVDPATLDPAATVPENEQVRAIVAPVTPARYWEGVFAVPSVGAFRSAFGSLRSYNGGPYDSFHTGVDFSGGEDRPITAPAPGVVVFAGPLSVRGNATLVDHGWGVYTGYWHQSVIQVTVGDRVETGQVIGFNGVTGRVTGPHLHWELWVGGIQVDPLQWTTDVFP